ncbi:MAG: cold-shock protein [Propionibacteriales bacterium]|nr:cold-shock protein [Propionibacteriales bacterium]
MATGKVKWYDTEKGFGFLTTDDGGDVFVRSDALPATVTSLKSGTRVEFGLVQGRRGDQAIQVSVLDPTPSVSKAMRKKPEDMVNIVEDLMKLLERLEETYRHGRHVEPRSAKQTAALLRALAGELEL